MENRIVAEPTRGRGRGRRGRRGGRVGGQAGRVRGQAGVKAGTALGGRGTAKVEGAGCAVEGSRQERTAGSELESIRQSDLTTKRTLARLPPVVKAENAAQELTYERILLPDAPPRKYARNDSPERQKCRLVPGTPAVPPPPKLMPWQVKQDPDSRSTLDHCPDPLSVVASGPTPLLCDWTTGGLSQNSTVEFLTRPPSSSAHSSWASSLASIPESTADTPMPEIARNLLTTAAPQQSPSQEPALKPADVNKFSGAASAITDADSIDADSTVVDDYIVKYFEQMSDSEDADAASEIGLNLCTDVDVEISAAEPALLPENMTSVLTDYIESEDIGADGFLTKLLDTDNVTFDWTNDPESFLGQRENFVGPCGPTFSLETTDRPLDVFLKYFDADLLDLIVFETNRNIRNMMTQTLPQYSRYQGLKKTNREEVGIFLAMLILQGNLPIPVEKEYFHENGFLTLKYFKHLMSYNRFSLLKSLLHFTDDSELTNDNNKLRKLGPLLNILSSKFKELYLPSRDIAIDESLLKWHGRLGFVQKIATKAAKVGIKTYELCESSSGYCWSFFIYTGKGHTYGQNDGQHDTDTQEMDRQGEDEGVVTPTNLTAQVVLDLVRPLFNRGHTLAMDNFYNSPLLARYLKRNGVDCFGTLRTNREFVPEAIKSMSKTALRPGEMMQTYCQDLSVTLWRDVNNLVAMLSTFHGGEVGGKEKYGQYKYKPQVVLDYNLSMGGVDKKDQLLSAHPIERIRNRSWYKKVFRRLLNVTILNAYIVYRTKNPSMTQRVFRSNLAAEMISMFKPELNQILCPLNDHPAQEAMIIKSKRDIRRPILKGNHFIDQGRSRNARCVYCREARTRFICKQCGVALCLKVCFEAFHTVP